MESSALQAEFAALMPFVNHHQESCRAASVPQHVSKDAGDAVEEVISGISEEELMPVASSDPYGAQSDSEMWVNTRARSKKSPSQARREGKRHRGTETSLGPKSIKTNTNPPKLVWARNRSKQT